MSTKKLFVALATPEMGVRAIVASEEANANLKKNVRADFKLLVLNQELLSTHERLLENHATYDIAFIDNLFDEELVHYFNERISPIMEMHTISIHIRKAFSLLGTLQNITSVAETATASTGVNSISQSFIIGSEIGRLYKSMLNRNALFKDMLMYKMAQPIRIKLPSCFTRELAIGVSMMPENEITETICPYLPHTGHKNGGREVDVFIVQGKHSLSIATPPHAEFLLRHIAGALLEKDYRLDTSFLPAFTPQINFKFTAPLSGSKRIDEVIGVVSKLYVSQTPPSIENSLQQHSVAH